jgi:hypothetical protein
MNNADTLFVAMLRSGPRGRFTSPPQVHLQQLSPNARAVLDELIVTVERRLRNHGIENHGVREDVYRLLGIDARLD